ncbi:MAG TPA: hypothetical protein VK509_14140 [Polyangiales bacterium]|nr:hypothetical protein [Polyangiales bacterium]
MSHSKEPPQLPDVVDEAGASPSWVPLLGFGLLCLFALVIALRQAAIELAPPPPPPAAALVADGGTAADDEPEAAPAAGSEAPPPAH